MTTKAALRSVESLKTWFMTANRPYWTVWTGFGKDNKDVAMRQSSISDMEQSWNLLQQISSQKLEGGGRITVFITDTVNSTHGFTEFVEVFPPASSAAISGIQTPGFVNGIDGYIADKIAMYEKDREIRDLREQLEAKNESTGINRIIDRLIEDAPIQELIMALAHKFLGPKLPHMAPAVNGAPPLTDDFEEEGLSDDENHRLQQAILTISKHVPDVVAALERLAAYVEKNPAMAKTFLQSL